MNNETMTYEEALLKLENLLAQFESGEPALEESFRLYNDGLKLVEFCSHALDEVEQKLVILKTGSEGADDEF